MNKCYYRIIWENYPSDKTPVNEQNLNRMDAAADEMDNRLISLDSTKFDKSEAQLLIKNITFDLQTGILKKYYYNGSTEEINTGISKLNMNLRFDKEDQILYIVNADGTEDPVDLSVFITNYEFEDSDTIAHNVSSDGTVTSIVKEGGIQERHLRPDYLADIKVESAKAEASAVESAASASKAKTSETNAKVSEVAAKESETNAESSAQAAAGSATEAKDSQDAAKVSEDNAAASAAAAGASEEAAAGSAQDAASSAADASTSAGEAEDYSLMSKSYAVGTEGQVRPNDPTDNSKYYSDLAQYLTDEAAKLLEQAQKIIAAATAGALIPSGTVAFENLPVEPKVGNMYNISNAFVTDDRFAEGPGIQYNPGANIYWTADGQWDVMIGVQVTGVKGATESYYRQGNVNLSATDIGLGNVPNVTTNNQTPTFTQAAAREPINSGETTSTLWGKVKKWLADLKSVAFSGSYNDLSDKPTAIKNPAALTFTGAVTGSYDGSAAKSVAIPSVGNGTVTIKQAGAQKGTFTMNQSGNTTIELTDNNTVYSLPLAASGTRGGVQIGYSANGKNYPVQLSGEKMFVNVPWTDGVATQTANGLMSAADKKKLDGIASNAQTQINNLNTKTDLLDKMATFNAVTNGTINDALLVDTNNYAGDANKPYGVLNSTTKNMPNDCAWGIRTVYFVGTNSIVVCICGVTSDGGTASIWSNCYNKNFWTGWRRF